MLDRFVLFACVPAIVSAWSPDTETKASALLMRMNLSEKVAMLHGHGPRCYWGAVGCVSGNDRLGIPPLVMANGGQGWGPWAGGQGNSTCWPSALTVGATFDVSLARRWGEAMGEEFFAKATNVQLGPGLCVARVPTDGRNFEYLSGEDPFLGFTLVQPVISGIQSKHVIANAKHWILNSQETNRASENNNVSERTRFEIYYPPFEGAIRAGVGSMMCSYNKINGAWSCQNNETLNTDLKERLGFEGFVVSDWGATHSTSITDGLDMEQPRDSHFGNALLSAVESNTIPVAAVDAAVRRVLLPMYELGVFDHVEWWSNSTARSATSTSAEHSALAREIAAAATVVVKNDASDVAGTQGVSPLLPISTSVQSIAVIGKQADTPTVHGGGSGSVSPTYIISPLEGITERATKAGLPAAKVVYDDGSNLTQAAAVAEGADITIVVVGDGSGEGSDRSTLAFSGTQNELVSAVAKVAGKKTAVVCLNPGSVLLPWSSEVAAVVMMFMPGLEAGNAAADVLWGDVNPSGRLPISIPNKDNEFGFTPEQYPGVDGTSHYTEELLVGYRWYDAHNVAPLYPFGHGLSYSTFAYSGLTTDSTTLTVECDITNTGKVPGAEVVQLYLAFPSISKEPPQQLKGFVKTTSLAPGAKAHVTFNLTQRDLSIWDETQHQWAMQKGTFGVHVGASSRNILLKGDITV